MEDQGQNEVKITYETLFDILRRERNRDEIQALEDSFYQDVLSYMAQKETLLKELGASAESEKARVQFLNIKKILRELYDRREKKIVLLTLNVIRTGVQMADKDSLLAEERLLFNDLLTLFGRYRSEVLESVLRQARPFGGVNPHHEKEHSIQATTNSQTESTKMEVEKPQKKEILSEKTPKKQAEKGTIKVKFLKAVPRFAGGGGVVFGPFSGGDQAELPEKIALVLLKKGRVEKIA